MMTSLKEVPQGTRKAVTLVLVIVGAALGFAMSACNTTEGFGKDVKNVGGGIEDSAARNK